MHYLCSLFLLGDTKVTLKPNLALIPKVLCPHVAAHLHGQESTADSRKGDQLFVSLAKLPLHKACLTGSWKLSNKHKLANQSTAGFPLGKVTWHFSLRHM